MNSNINKQGLFYVGSKMTSPRSNAWALFRYYTDRGDHIRKHLIETKHIWKFNPEKPRDDYFLIKSEAGKMNKFVIQVIDVGTKEYLEKSDKSDLDNMKKPRAKFNRLSITDIEMKIKARDGDPLAQPSQPKLKSHKPSKSKARKDTPTSPKHQKNFKIKAVDPNMEEILKYKADQLIDLEEDNASVVGGERQKMIEYEEKIEELVLQNSKLEDDKRVLLAKLEHLRNVARTLELDLQEAQKKLDEAKRRSAAQVPDEASETNSAPETSAVTSDSGCAPGNGSEKESDPGEDLSDERIAYYLQHETRKKYERFNGVNPVTGKFEELIHIGFGFNISWETFRQVRNKSPEEMLRAVLPAMYRLDKFANRYVRMQSEPDLAFDSPRHELTPMKRTAAQLVFDDQIIKKIKIDSDYGSRAKIKLEEQRTEIRSKFNEIAGDRIGWARKQVMKIRDEMDQPDAAKSGHGPKRSKKGAAARRKKVMAAKLAEAGEALRRYRVDNDLVVTPRSRPKDNHPSSHANMSSQHSDTRSLDRYPSFTEGGAASPSPSTDAVHTEVNVAQPSPSRRGRTTGARRSLFQYRVPVRCHKKVQALDQRRSRSRSSSKKRLRSQSRSRSRSVTPYEKRSRSRSRERSSSRSEYHCGLRSSTPREERSRSKSKARCHRSRSGERPSSSTSHTGTPCRRSNDFSPLGSNNLLRDSPSPVPPSLTYRSFTGNPLVNYSQSSLSELDLSDSEKQCHSRSTSPPQDRSHVSEGVHYQSPAVSLFTSSSTERSASLVQASRKENDDFLSKRIPSHPPSNYSPSYLSPKRRHRRQNSYKRIRPVIPDSSPEMA